MAIKASNQITLQDISDAYSVILTSEAYTFVGGVNGVVAGAACTTQAVAYCGTNQCQNVTIGTITCPTGIKAEIANSGGSAPTITFTTTATVASDCEATIPVSVGDVTIEKKFSFAVAKTGATGAKGDTGATGSQWYTGTGITGNSTTAAVFSSSGVSSAKVNDMYLNTSTGYTYKCTTAGAASAAKWVYAGSIKGATGNTGATGSQWYSGTGITGTSTTAAVFSSSGVSSAKVNDMYLNTSTGNTYKCTTAGAASAAKWIYAGSIKGAAGDDGADAITLTITSSAGTVFKNSTGETTLTAHVYKAGAEQTINADTGVVANSLGTIKWYKSTDTSTVLATAGTYKVTADDIDSVGAYTCQLED